MEPELKSISRAGIAEAVAKVELYRYLNEPEEAESICRDILAVDAAHQLARRMLGLSITDQFTGYAGDRYAEAAEVFAGLRDEYERLYYTGLLLERRAKVQLRSGYSAHILLPLIEEALKCFGKRRKFVLREMTTASCAGIAACVCCKASQTFAWNAMLFHTRRRTLLRRIYAPSAQISWGIF